MKTLKINVPLFLIELLIFLTTFRGIIDNFIGQGTLCVDICIIFLIIYTFIYMLLEKRFYLTNKNIVYAYLLWAFMFFMNFIIQMFIDRTNLRDGILGFRNDVVYTYPFVFILLFVKEKDIYKIYSLIRNTAFLINIFAIIQFVFRDTLSLKFLVPNGQDVFAFWGSNIIRVTGLMGNTIEYGGYVVMIISMLWAEIIIKKFKSLFLWIQLAVAIIANNLTFSRASIAGMIIVLILEYIISSPTKQTLSLIKRYTILILIGIVFIKFILIYFEDAIIIQRLLGTNNLWNEDSDTIHMKTIQDAIHYIRNNPIIGYGIGKVGGSNTLGSKAIIRDGSFWMYPLQWGIPLSTLYWLLILRFIYIAFKNIKCEDPSIKTMCIAYIGMNAYLISFSFINSAYSARFVTIIIWTICGLFINKLYKEK